MKPTNYLKIKELIRQIKRILINDYQTEDYKAEDIFILIDEIENIINKKTKEQRK